MYKLNEFKENKAFISDKETDKYFCINTKGEVLFELPTGVKNASNFCGNFAIVQNSDNLQTVINEKGEFLHDFKYKKICSLPSNPQDIPMFAVLNENNKLGFVDLEFMEIIPFIYDDIRYLDSEIALLLKDGKTGAINLKDNKTIIPFEYEELYCLAWKDVIIAKSGDKFGLIDKNNNIITDFKFDNIYKPNPDDKCIFAEIGDKYGVIDKQGKIIEEFVYDEIYRESDSYISAVTKYSNDNICLDCKFGVENNCLNCAKARKTALYSTKEAKFLTDFEYGITQASSFDAKTIIVEQYGKYGLIDAEKKIILPFIYRNIHKQCDDNLFLVKNLDGLEGLVNEFGEIVIPIKYHSLDYIKEGLYRASDKNSLKTGIIDKENNIIVPLDDSFYIKLCFAEYQCGYIVAETKDGNEVYIDKKGKVLEIKTQKQTTA